MHSFSSLVFTKLHVSCMYMYVSIVQCLLPHYQLPFTGLKKQQARNRWAVAYTLVHNPSLRPLRAAQLKQQASTEEINGDRHYEETEAVLLPLIN